MDTAPLAVALVVVALTVYIFARRAARARATRCRVTQIVVYPLKSARGVSVSSAALDARGLEFDRLWMVVDAGGAFVSQRRAPRLALRLGLERRVGGHGRQPLLQRVVRPDQLGLLRRPLLRRLLRLLLPLAQRGAALLVAELGQALPLPRALTLLAHPSPSARVHSVPLNY